MFLFSKKNSKFKENNDNHGPNRSKISHENSFFNQNLNVICRRFPRVSRKILKKLDDQSLEKSKEVCREIVQVLCNERFYWIRIIKSYVGKSGGEKEAWKEVITKIPVNVSKQLALAVIQFFEYHLFRQMSPLHIVAENGNVQLCQYILNLF